MRWAVILILLQPSVIIVTTLEAVHPLHSSSDNGDDNDEASSAQPINQQNSLHWPSNLKHYRNLSSNSGAEDSDLCSVDKKTLPSTVPTFDYRQFENVNEDPSSRPKEATSKWFKRRRSYLKHLAQLLENGIEQSSKSSSSQHKQSGKFDKSSRKRNRQHFQSNGAEYEPRKFRTKKFRLSSEGSDVSPGMFHAKIGHLELSDESQSDPVSWPRTLKLRPDHVKPKPLRLKTNLAPDRIKLQLGQSHRPQVTSVSEKSTSSVAKQKSKFFNSKSSKNRELRSKSTSIEGSDSRSSGCSTKTKGQSRSSKSSALISVCKSHEKKPHPYCHSETAVEASRRSGSDKVVSRSDEAAKKIDDSCPEPSDGNKATSKEGSSQNPFLYHYHDSGNKCHGFGEVPFERSKRLKAKKKPNQKNKRLPKRFSSAAIDFPKSDKLARSSLKRRKVQENDLSKHSAHLSKVKQKQSFEIDLSSDLEPPTEIHRKLSHKTFKGHCKQVQSKRRRSRASRANVDKPFFRDSYESHESHELRKVSSHRNRTFRRFSEDASVESKYLSSGHRRGHRRKNDRSIDEPKGAVKTLKKHSRQSKRRKPSSSKDLHRSSVSHSLPRKLTVRLKQDERDSRRHRRRRRKGQSKPNRQLSKRRHRKLPHKRWHSKRSKPKTRRKYAEPHRHHTKTSGLMSPKRRHWTTTVEAPAMKRRLHANIRQPSGESAHLSRPKLYLRGNRLKIKLKRYKDSIYQVPKSKKQARRRRKKSKPEVLKRRLHVKLRGQPNDKFPYSLRKFQVRNNRLKVKLDRPWYTRQSSGKLKKYGKRYRKLPHRRRSESSRRRPKSKDLNLERRLHVNIRQPSGESASLSRPKLKVHGNRVHLQLRRHFKVPSYAEASTVPRGKVRKSAIENVATKRRLHVKLHKKLIDEARYRPKKIWVDDNRMRLQLYRFPNWRRLYEISRRSIDKRRKHQRFKKSKPPPGLMSRAMKRRLHVKIYSKQSSDEARYRIQNVHIQGKRLKLKLQRTWESGSSDDDVAIRKRENIAKRASNGSSVDNVIAAPDGKIQLKLKKTDSKIGNKRHRRLPHRRLVTRSESPLSKYGRSMVRKSKLRQRPLGLLSREMKRRFHVKIHSKQRKDAAHYRTRKIRIHNNRLKLKLQRTWQSSSEDETGILKSGGINKRSTKKKMRMQSSTDSDLRAPRRKVHLKLKKKDSKLGKRRNLQLPQKRPVKWPKEPVTKRRLHVKLHAQSDDSGLYKVRQVRPGKKKLELKLERFPQTNDDALADKPLHVELHQPPGDKTLLKPRKLKAKGDRLKMKLERYVDDDPIDREVGFVHRQKRQVASSDSVSISDYSKAVRDTLPPVTTVKRSTQSKHVAERHLHVKLHKQLSDEARYRLGNVVADENRLRMELYRFPNWRRLYKRSRRSIGKRPKQHGVKRSKLKQSPPGLLRRLHIDDCTSNVDEDRFYDKNTISKPRRSKRGVNNRGLPKKMRDYSSKDSDVSLPRRKVLLKVKKTDSKPGHKRHRRLPHKRFPLSKRKSKHRRSSHRTEDGGLTGKRLHVKLHQLSGDDTRVRPRKLKFSGNRLKMNLEHQVTSSDSVSISDYSKAMRGTSPTDQKVKRSTPKHVAKRLLHVKLHKQLSDEARYRPRKAVADENRLRLELYRFPNWRRLNKRSRRSIGKLRKQHGVKRSELKQSPPGLLRRLHIKLHSKQRDDEARYRTRNVQIHNNRLKLKLQRTWESSSIDSEVSLPRRKVHLQLKKTDSKPGNRRHRQLPHKRLVAKSTKSSTNLVPPLKRRFQVKLHQLPGDSTEIKLRKMYLDNNRLKMKFERNVDNDHFHEKGTIGSSDEEPTRLKRGVNNRRLTKKMRDYSSEDSERRRKVHLKLKKTDSKPETNRHRRLPHKRFPLSKRKSKNRRSSRRTANGNVTEKRLHVKLHQLSGDDTRVRPRKLKVSGNRLNMKLERDVDDDHFYEKYKVRKKVPRVNKRRLHVKLHQKWDDEASLKLRKIHVRPNGIKLDLEQNAEAIKQSPDGILLNQKLVRTNASKQRLHIKLRQLPNDTASYTPSKISLHGNHLKLKLHRSEEIQLTVKSTRTTKHRLHLKLHQHVRDQDYYKPLKTAIHGNQMKLKFQRVAGARLGNQRRVLRHAPGLIAREKEGDTSFEDEENFGPDKRRLHVKLRRQPGDRTRSKLSKVSAHDNELPSESQKRLPYEKLRFLPHKGRKRPRVKHHRQDNASYRGGREVHRKPQTKLERFVSNDREALLRNSSVRPVERRLHVQIHQQPGDEAFYAPRKMKIRGQRLNLKLERHLPPAERFYDIREAKKHRLHIKLRGQSNDTARYEIGKVQVHRNRVNLKLRRYLDSYELEPLHRRRRRRSFDEERFPSSKRRLHLKLQRQPDGDADNNPRPHDMSNLKLERKRRGKIRPHLAKKRRLHVRIHPNPDDVARYKPRRIAVHGGRLKVKLERKFPEPRLADSRRPKPLRKVPKAKAPKQKLHVKLHRQPGDTGRYTTRDVELRGDRLKVKLQRLAEDPESYEMVPSSQKRHQLHIKLHQKPVNVEHRKSRKTEHRRKAKPLKKKLHVKLHQRSDDSAHYTPRKIAIKGNRMKLKLWRSAEVSMASKTPQQKRRHMKLHQQRFRKLPQQRSLHIKFQEQQAEHGSAERSRNGIKLKLKRSAEVPDVRQKVQKPRTMKQKLHVKLHQKPGDPGRYSPRMIGVAGNRLKLKLQRSTEVQKKLPSLPLQRRLHIKLRQHPGDNGHYTPRSAKMSRNGIKLKLKRSEEVPISVNKDPHKRQRLHVKLHQQPGDNDRYTPHAVKIGGNSLKLKLHRKERRFEPPLTRKQRLHLKLEQQSDDEARYTEKVAIHRKLKSANSSNSIEDSDPPKKRRLHVKLHQRSDDDGRYTPRRLGVHGNRLKLKIQRTAKVRKHLEKVPGSRKGERLPVNIDPATDDDARYETRNVELVNNRRTLKLHRSPHRSAGKMLRRAKRSISSSETEESRFSQMGQSSLPDDDIHHSRLHVKLHPKPDDTGRYRPRKIVISGNRLKMKLERSAKVHKPSRKHQGLPRNHRLHVKLHGQADDMGLNKHRKSGLHNNNLQLKLERFEKVPKKGLKKVSKPPRKGRLHVKLHQRSDDEAEYIPRKVHFSKDGVKLRVERKFKKPKPGLLATKRRFHVKLRQQPKDDASFKRLDIQNRGNRVNLKLERSFEEVPKQRRLRRSEETSPKFVPDNRRLRIKLHKSRDDSAIYRPQKVNLKGKHLNLKLEQFKFEGQAEPHPSGQLHLKLHQHPRDHAHFRPTKVSIHGNRLKLNLEHNMTSSELRNDQRQLRHRRLADSRLPMEPRAAEQRLHVKVHRQPGDSGTYEPLKLGLRGNRLKLKLERSEKASHQLTNKQRLHLKLHPQLDDDAHYQPRKIGLMGQKLKLKLERIQIRERGKAIRKPQAKRRLHVKLHRQPDDNGHFVPRKVRLSKNGVKLELERKLSKPEGLLNKPHRRLHLKLHRRANDSAMYEPRKIRIKGNHVNLELERFADDQEHVGRVPLRRKPRAKSLQASRHEASAKHHRLHVKLHQLPDDVGHYTPRSIGLHGNRLNLKMKRSAEVQRPSIKARRLPDKNRLHVKLHQQHDDAGRYRPLAIGLRGKRIKLKLQRSDEVQEINELPDERRLHVNIHRQQGDRAHYTPRKVLVRGNKAKLKLHRKLEASLEAMETGSPKLHLKLHRQTDDKARYHPHNVAVRGNRLKLKLQRSFEVQESAKKVSKLSKKRRLHLKLHQMDDGAGSYVPRRIGLHDNRLKLRLERSERVPRVRRVPHLLSNRRLHIKLHQQPDGEARYKPRKVKIHGDRVNLKLERQLQNPSPSPDGLLAQDRRLHIKLRQQKDDATRSKPRKLSIHGNRMNLKLEREKLKVIPRNRRLHVNIHGQHNDDGHYTPTKIGIHGERLKVKLKRSAEVPATSRKVQDPKTMKQKIHMKLHQKPGDPGHYTPRTIGVSGNRLKLKLQRSTEVQQRLPSLPPLRRLHVKLHQHPGDNGHYTPRSAKMSRNGIKLKLKRSAEVPIPLNKVPPKRKRLHVKLHQQPGDNDRYTPRAVKIDRNSLKLKLHRKERRFEPPLTRKQRLHLKLQQQSDDEARFTPRKVVIRDGRMKLEMERSAKVRKPVEKTPKVNQRIHVKLHKQPGDAGHYTPLKLGARGNRLKLNLKRSEELPEKRRLHVKLHQPPDDEALYKPRKLNIGRNGVKLNLERKIKLPNKSTERRPLKRKLHVKLHQRPDDNARYTPKKINIGNNRMNLKFQRSNEVPMGGQQDPKVPVKQRLHVNLHQQPDDDAIYTPRKIDIRNNRMKLKLQRSDKVPKAAEKDRPRYRLHVNLHQQPDDSARYTLKNIAIRKNRMKLKLQRSYEVREATKKGPKLPNDRRLHVKLHQQSGDEARYTPTKVEFGNNRMKLKLERSYEVPHWTKKGPSLLPTEQRLHVKLHKQPNDNVRYTPKKIAIRNNRMKINLERSSEIPEAAKKAPMLAPKRRLHVNLHQQRDDHARYTPKKIDLRNNRINLKLQRSHEVSVEANEVPILPPERRLHVKLHKRRDDNARYSPKEVDLHNNRLKLKLQRFDEVPVVPSRVPVGKKERPLKKRLHVNLHQQADDDARYTPKKVAIRHDRMKIKLERSVEVLEAARKGPKMPTEQRLHVTLHQQPGDEARYTPKKIDFHNNHMKLKLHRSLEVPAVTKKDRPSKNRLHVNLRQQPDDHARYTPKTIDLQNNRLKLKLQRGDEVSVVPSQVPFYKKEWPTKKRLHVNLHQQPEDDAQYTPRKMAIHDGRVNLKLRRSFEEVVSLPTKHRLHVNLHQQPSDTALHTPRKVRMFDNRLKLEVERSEPRPTLPEKIRLHVKLHQQPNDTASYTPEKVQFHNDSLKLKLMRESTTSTESSNDVSMAVPSRQPSKMLKELNNTRRQCEPASETTDSRETESNKPPKLRLLLKLHQPVERSVERHRDGHNKHRKPFWVHPHCPSGEAFFALHRKIYHPDE